MDYMSYALPLGLTVLLGVLLILRYRPQGKVRPVASKGPIEFEKVTLCLTEADQLYFIRQRKKLADLGFVDIGDFTLAGRTPKGIYRAMAHSQEPIYAVLSEIFTKKPQQYLTFYSRLSEGLPLKTDNLEIPDKGGHPRLQRIPGALSKETFEHHQTCLKELKNDGIKAHPTSREGFYQEFAEILIIQNLSEKGSYRQEDLAKELSKLPTLNVAKMLKPLTSTAQETVQEAPVPDPKAEKKAVTKELALLKERKEQAAKRASEAPSEVPAPPMEQELTTTVPATPAPPVAAPPFVPIEEPKVLPETLIKFDDIPLDAPAVLPFALTEAAPEEPIPAPFLQAPPEVKPDPLPEVKPEPSIETKTEPMPEPEAKAEPPKEEKKPSRLKAPDKCPACGEPVLSPLSSYCRKCKAYLRGN